MTFSELKKKDMICIGDGRVIGRACDVVLDPATGQALGLIVCGGCGIFRSEKSQMEIPWRQIACIGDDVILVFAGELLKGVYLFSEYGYNKRMGKCKIFQNEG